MGSALRSEPTQWAEFLAAHHGHLLQSWAWGELKSRFGWAPQRLQVDGAAAQVLFRRLPLGWTIGYIPKGPLVDWHNLDQCQALLSAIHTEARKRRAILLKIEPDIWRPDSDSNSSESASSQRFKALAHFFQQANFIPADPIQPQSSIVIDISGDEDSILAAMKQKTRYNIRLAQRKGVAIRQGSEADLPTFYHLSRLTAARDGFGIHSPAYYQAAYHLFSPDRCVLLMAEFKGEPLAALMVFRQGCDAYYFYGASSNTHRNLMASYLIQWAAIGWAKSQGCARYDLWGIPNADIATLETKFTRHAGGLWGVYRFKRGFSGQIVRSVGAYDYVYNRPLYRLYKLRRNISIQKLRSAP
jgi:lipid II:glycine glycyltransferase (peptidoglycan interpeptide bridge formation enzyme)